MGWSLFRKTGLTFHSPAQSFKGYTLVTPIAADFSVLLDAPDFSGLAGLSPDPGRYADFNRLYGLT